MYKKIGNCTLSKIFEYLFNTTIYNIFTNVYVNIADVFFFFGKYSIKNK
jgi:hypothetical protein